MDAAGRTGSQSHITIVHIGLRERQEHQPPRRAKAEERRHQQRHETDAYEAGDGTVFVDELEGPVSGCDQPAREGDALRLVAVEKARIGAPLEHRGELPSEVDGIPDAGIHALAANGTVDMSGIAEKEGAAFAEMLRHPVMDA